MRWIALLLVAACGCSGLRLRFKPQTGARIKVHIKGTLSETTSPADRYLEMVVRGYSGGNVILLTRPRGTQQKTPQLLLMVTRRMGLVSINPAETEEESMEEGTISRLQFSAVVMLPFLCEWLPSERVNPGARWKAEPVLTTPNEEDEETVFEMLFTGYEGDLLRLEGRLSRACAPFGKGWRVVVLWDKLARMPRFVEFKAKGNRKLRYTFSVKEESE